MIETQEENIRKPAEEKARKAPRIPVILVTIVTFAIFMSVALFFGSPDILENRRIFWVSVGIGLLISVVCSLAAIHLQKLGVKKDEM